MTPVNLPTSSDQATNPYGAKNSLNTDASSTGQVPQTPVVPPIVNNVPINTASPSLPRRIPV